jgi:uncharacterized protein with HEPN domain
MDLRTLTRLEDIVEHVDLIEQLLDGRVQDDLMSDRVLRAAYERFLEIVSEASRNLPDAIKTDAPAINWRQIADLGNHLRHGYQGTDLDILWRIYASGLIFELRDVAADAIAKDDSTTL